MTAPQEQRNPYLGTPPRPWISLRLAAKDGTTRVFKVIADTGNPFALILDARSFADFNHRAGPSADTNFGPLDAGWVKLVMPEMGLDRLVLGCGSDEVAAGAKSDHSDFEGLAGLPLLRLLEYGGNAEEFWIRRRV